MLVLKLLKVYKLFTDIGSLAVKVINALESPSVKAVPIINQK